MYDVRQQKVYWVMDSPIKSLIMTSNTQLGFKSL